MEEDIKILEKMMEKANVENADMNDCFGGEHIEAIENLIKAYKQKDKDNNDLRRLYRRTAKKLGENGKEELADYFLAQINEVPTFTIDDDIDYYTEYYRLKEEIKNKRKEYQETYKDVREELKELKQENAELKVKIINIRHKTIPVSLVEEKIEELKQERTLKYDNYMGYKIESREQQDIDKKVQVLQELLEGRKEREE